MTSLSGSAIPQPLSVHDNENCSQLCEAPTPLTGSTRCVRDLLDFFHKKADPMTKDSRLFDIIVLAGMVVNILVAVFMVAYYFELI